MVVEYNGLPPAMDVTIEWFDPVGTPIFNETKNMTHYPSDNYAAAFSNWTATMTGDNFTVRGTHIGTAISSEAKFNVSEYEDSAMVETLSIATSSPFYENNTMAKATTSMGYLGNGSRLGNVSFVWRYPNGTVAFAEDVDSPDGGLNGTVEVNSSWRTDSVGTNYEVQATYNGIQPLTDTAYFDVIPERIKTWKNVSISGVTTWAKNESPFGICANITVEAGAALTVEAGSVIRFCPNSGMTVRGMLIMEGLPSSPIILTSYSYPSNPGDWKSVTFENESDDVGSSLNSVMMEYSQRGFVFNSASPAIVNVTVTNSSISGTEVYQSDILMTGVYLANSARGIYTSHSTLNLLDSEILNCDDGIVMEDSDGWLEGNFIHDNIERGIWAVRSNPTIWGNLIVLNADKGIRIEGSQNVLIAENIIGWSNFTFDSFQSLGLSLRFNYILNGAVVGLSFWTTDDVLVENSTIETSLASFRVAGGSIVRALNCTFDDTVVTVTGGSRLYVEYFLHVGVTDMVGSPLEGAAVTLILDGISSTRGYTGPDGWMRWLVIRHETFSGLVTDPDVTSVILELNLEGYNITDSRREMNMSISRTEYFQGEPIIPPDDGDGVDPFSLIIVGILGVIIAALLAIFVIIIMVRRRRKAEEEFPELEIREGKIHIVSQDGQGRSLDKFKSEIHSGSKGLCFTRTYPKNLRKRHDLGDADVVWLSRDVEKGGLMPTNLGLITNEVDKFLEANRDARRVILLDGLAYLIAQNGFGKVLKLLNHLKDTMGVHNGAMIIPFDMNAVDDKEAAMLRADFKVI